MQIQLYQFAKKKNSTIQPDQGVAVDVVLKEPTNMLSPVIRITQTRIGAGIAPTMYNYVYIPKFTRYYFISNWDYTGGCWECTCICDVMASWKTYISAQSVYVERAQAEYDGNIIDAMFPAKTDYTKKYASVATSWLNVAPSGGTYVLGIINDQNTKTVGAVTYYALTPTIISTFISYIFGNNIFQSSNINEISEGLFKGLFNPAQYIVSCTWFPESQSHFGSTSASIKIGYWDTGINGVLVETLAVRQVITATFPNHDQASTRGNFLNFSPYAYYTLYVPPFGAIPIDSSVRAHGDYMRSYVYIDHITGQATLRIGVSNVQAGDPNIFSGEVTAMFGVPIQLAQVMSDYTGGIGQAVGGLLSGNILSVLSGAVQSAISAYSPQVQSMGANGSFIMDIIDPCIIATFANITDPSDSILGRPLMKQKAIATLSGFIKCSNVHVNIPCMDEEREQIEAMMNTGFYYE